MPTRDTLLAAHADCERVETLCRQRQWDAWCARMAAVLAKPCTRGELVAELTPLVASFGAWALRAGQSAGRDDATRRQLAQRPSPSTRTRTRTRTRTHNETA
jgi:hypothetical protein